MTEILSVIPYEIFSKDSLTGKRFRNETSLSSTKNIIGPYTNSVVANGILYYAHDDSGTRRKT